ncbi:25.3 kDa vesicle transport protein SEC22-1-like isoform X1 [Rosa rugosa]|uniref:25.3 kDa vesicle transport protein SEC22-1-like isoform X1 n=1 Tax=Rosa rugosa TaxID=74645 RepID=UPI002B40D9D0|nr:25.3 kDa vesicle transport protein SEC22-1-like isoform X1 [Rosa rugosa]XP_062018653.1 25.3 kDa vesicle transport protein SEC22-1-like isoform X1 [Rosa rugosa]
MSFQFSSMMFIFCISIPNNTGFLFFSVYGYVINGCMTLQVNNFVRLSVGSFSTCKTIYAFIKFDTFIQRTKKLYQDTCTQRTISKLNNELYEVHQIMTCNIQEVLGVGEKLDSFLFFVQFSLFQSCICFNEENFSNLL